ncbi:hypothetical protein V501_07538 [Pseudogymnoascus sp. VKM F-4519 (FW-2642)]|nr:hypothetical protein V501_07538 [Pseudogymnoascus sp. VKM F-4519 (FW-2642)]
MHLSSAALLLLLVPATRAAAIPAQGGLLGGDKLANTVVNTALGGGHVGGPATVKRDESTNLLGTVMEAVSFGKTVSDEADKATGVKILQRDEATNLLGPVTDAAKLGETVSEVANNGVAGLAMTKRDEDAVALANNIRKLSYEQLGQLARLLKIISGGVSTTSKRSAAFNPADLKVVVDLLGDLTQPGGNAKSKRSAPFIPEEMRNELSLLITGKPFDEQTNDVDSKRDITGTEVAGAIAYAEKLAAGPAGQLADLQNGSPLRRRQDKIASTVPTVAEKAAEAVVDVSLKVVDTVPGVGKSKRGAPGGVEDTNPLGIDVGAPFYSVGGAVDGVFSRNNVGKEGVAESG